jgi:hypothetical protein
MEAGGFDYGKANLKSIRILRTQNGRTEHYTLNLKKVLEGPRTGTIHSQACGHYLRARKI